MFQGIADAERFVITYGNKNVEVTAIFPEQPDSIAEQGFANRLKEIYFREMDGNRCAR